MHRSFYCAIGGSALLVLSAGMLFQAFACVVDNGIQRCLAKMKVAAPVYRPLCSSWHGFQVAYSRLSKCVLPYQAKRGGNEKYLL